MASMTTQTLVAPNAALALRPRASWRPAVSPMPSMCASAPLAALAPSAPAMSAPSAYAAIESSFANAIATGLTLHRVNGHKPFTRWPEESPT